MKIEKKNRSNVILLIVLLIGCSAVRTQAQVIKDDSLSPKPTLLEINDYETSIGEKFTEKNILLSNLAPVLESNTLQGLEMGINETKETNSEKRILSSKTILSFGSGINQLASSDSGAAQLLNSNKAFGASLASKVSLAGFTVIDGGTPTNVTPIDYLIEQRPDIVVLGSNSQICASNAVSLAKYVNDGGVLLIFNEGNGGGTRGSAATLMNAIFGVSTISQKSFYTKRAVYSLSSVNDPVLNGVFGDVRGLQWGENASSTCGLFGLPDDQVDVYSLAIDESTDDLDNPDYVMAFRHKTKNVLFFGDGSFISENLGDPSSTPFILDEKTGLPLPNSNYMTTGGSFSVYNSVIFANAMAWAMNQAENNGINR